MKTGVIVQNTDIHVAETNLEILREQINKVDEQLLQTLWFRLDIARRIGSYKKANNMQVVQLSRWEKVLKNRINMARAMGLNTVFIEQVYNLIHKESIAVQEELLRELKGL